jgi:hypothetical protein
MASGEKKSKPKIVQAPDLVTFYANGARIVKSEYEGRIYFSDQVPPDPSDPSGQSTSVERVCVIMAPRFAAQLSEQIYDAYQGEILEMEAESDG